MISVGDETGKHIAVLSPNLSVCCREGYQKMYHAGSRYFPSRTRASVLGLPSKAKDDLAISASFVLKF